MAAVSQTMLSNALSWMKMYEFCLKFHSEYQRRGIPHTFTLTPKSARQSMGLHDFLFKMTLVSSAWVQTRFR